MPVRDVRGLASLAIVVAAIVAGTANAASPVARAECDQPRSLRLSHYEDGSARLYCERRELMRVSVPW